MRAGAAARGAGNASGPSGAVGVNYAEALFELASRDDAGEEYGEMLDEVVILYRDPEVQRFLDTPRVGLPEKKELLRSVLGDKLPEGFLRFLFIVLEKQRQRVLPEIAEAYRDLVDQREGRVRASIVLAFEPDEAVKAEIVEALEGVAGQRVVPHFRLNPDLLGGAVVRMQDYMLDGSLRRRLEVLRRSLLARKVAEAEPEDGTNRATEG